MNAKNALTTFIAFCLAVSVAFLVYFLQKPSSKTPVQEKRAEYNTASVLQAKVALNPGDKIDIAQLEWEKWPKESIDPEYYTQENTKKIQDLSGAIVRYAISKGSPIKRTDLIFIGDKSIVTAFVGPKKRAVSIPLSQVDNPSVHFAPGDYVDIILPNRGKEGETEVDLLIKGVKIIAVDQYLQQGQSQGGKPLSTVPKTITVEVDTKQAELLAESIFDGHIILSQYSAFTPPKASEMGVSEAKKTPTNATITILRGAGDGKPQDGLSSILPLPPSPSPSPSLSNQGQRE